MVTVDDMLGKQVLVKYPKVVLGDTTIELDNETGILLQILDDSFLIKDHLGRLILTPKANAKLILLQGGQS